MSLNLIRISIYKIRFIRWSKIFLVNLFSVTCSVGWDNRIHRLYLYRGERTPTPPNECPGYDTKQSDGEATVMLELWGTRSTPSLPLLPGPLWLGVVAPDRVLSMGQIELNCVPMLNGITWNRTIFDIETVLTLNWIVWNRTVLTFNSV